jgi:hypothetical protein
MTCETYLSVLKWHNAEVDMAHMHVSLIKKRKYL